MDVSVLIRLIDQVTGPAKKVGDSLAGIGTKSKELAREAARGFGGAIREGFSVENIEQATKKAEQALSRSRGRLMGAIGMAMSVAAPLMKSGQFDQAMRGLDKVLDVPEARLKALRRFALDTSALIPIAARELVELMAEAAQGGVPQEELEAFSTYVANAAVAFDMAGAEIGERFAKLRNVYKLNQDGIQDLGDATNHLSNNMAAKASEITDFSNRAAGAAAIFKLSATEISAVGTALIAAGVVPETAARGLTAIATRILGGGKEIDKAFRMIGTNRKQFMKDLEADGPAALQKLFETLATSEKGMEALIGIAGRDFADDFAKLLGNPKLLAQAFALIADSSAYAGSAVDEAAKQGAGATKQWELFANKLTRLSIVIGDQLLPPAIELLERIGGIVDQMAALAQANPELTSTVVQAAAALMGLMIAGRLLSFIIASIRLPLIGLAATFLKFENGRNIATGWRLMSGAARGLGSAGRFATRSLLNLTDRIGGLRNVLRGGIFAGWAIPLAFEFVDDMGRTPEQRIEQIRRNREAYDKLEKDVDASGFGKWWQSLKDGANEMMGLEAGQVPAEVFSAWLQQGWEQVDAQWASLSTRVRAKANEVGTYTLAGLSSGWASVEQWFDQGKSWLASVWADLDLSGMASNALDSLLAGFTSAWARIESWVTAKVDWLKNAFSFEFTPPSWWPEFLGGSNTNDPATKLVEAVSGGGGSNVAPSPIAAAAEQANQGGGQFDGLLAGMRGAAGAAGDDIERGGRAGGDAVAQGGRDAGNALSQAASDIRSAAASIAAAARRGGSVSSALSSSRTGALHGGTE